MPNDYFQFKQFLINQDKCAMKVCSDSCLFGAWAATKIKNQYLPVKNILDIGTGTGLLSLMLAQELPAVEIDTLEIDVAAACQAKENFEASPWRNRLFIHPVSIQNFEVSIDKKYDIIICNPPFFENDLKSIFKKRNLAMHSDELKLDELLNISGSLLSDKGFLYLLLPYTRLAVVEKLLNGKLFIGEKALVRQTPNHGFFRCMLMLSKKAAVPTQSEIIILENKNEYSDKFKSYLKSYYLFLS